MAVFLQVGVEPEEFLRQREGLVKIALFLDVLLEPALDARILRSGGPPGDETRKELELVVLGEERLHGEQFVIASVLHNRERFFDMIQSEQAVDQVVGETGLAADAQIGFVIQRVGFQLQQHGAQRLALPAGAPVVACRHCRPRQLGQHLLFSGRRPFDEEAGRLIADTVATRLEIPVIDFK